MDIRFAKTEDTPAILRLLQQVGAVHHAGRPDIFRNGAQKYGASQVMALMNKPGTAIFVAVEGEEVLGYCFCFLKTYEKDPVLCDRTELYIDDLCIDEDRRGQHIGKALYDAACHYAKESRCHSVTLNVWCCNESALRFYEHLGMTPLKIGMEQIL